MTLTLPSFAKINWTLEVLGRRPDGYHELRTLLQTVSLGDELRFEPRARGVEVVCDHPGVPRDETNLVARAAALLAERIGVERGVRVEIVKRIPLAAGLGGGSSNAAVTLLALMRLWGVRLAPRDLFALGARLGADVPFFFCGGTCLGVGRGDEVYPLAEMRAPRLLLVNVGVAVETREIYANLPPELTKPRPAAMMPFTLEAAYRAMTEGESLLQPAPQQPPQQTMLWNDLEGPVLARHPLLSEVRRRLASAGAGAVLMSGSGATIFAIFDSEATLGAAHQEMTKAGWWCARARTLDRVEYQAALSAARP